MKIVSSEGAPLLPKRYFNDLTPKARGTFEGVGQPPLYSRSQHEAIDDQIDFVRLPCLDIDLFRQFMDFPINLNADETGARQLLQHRPRITARHNGRQHKYTCLLRQRQQLIADLLDGMRCYFAAALNASRLTYPREKQPQIVVNLGEGSYRRTRVRQTSLLLDGDGRRKAIDGIDVRLFHLLQKLTGIRGERLQIPPLPFGVERIESERRLARSGNSGDDNQPIARDFDIDVFKL